MDRPMEPAEALLYDKLRPELEARVRAEMEPVFDERIALARDRATRALVVTVLMGAPILALVAGASVRLFLWAAGFR
jgi:hypothetical protein